LGEEHRVLVRRMAVGKMDRERRKYKRVSVDFPVVYRIQGVTVMGKAVNASNEGMMVESHIGLENALRIVQILANRQRLTLDLQFTYKNRGFRTEAEMKHFHLHFLGKEPCRSELGVFMPKIE